MNKIADVVNSNECSEEETCSKLEQHSCSESKKDNCLKLEQDSCSESEEDSSSESEEDSSSESENEKIIGYKLSKKQSKIYYLNRKNIL